MDEMKDTIISGAGATLPMPLYIQLISEYNKKGKTKVVYTGVGSEAGILSLKDKKVDFGATDIYLNDIRVSEFGAPIIHIPTCIGAVVLAYNLPGITSLKLKNEVLSRIFMGEITRWNDKAIKKDNPGTKLPDKNITLIHRSDGSGTTFIFSSYMSRVSKRWTNKIGTVKNLKLPIGKSAQGNTGVERLIMETDGALGYLAYEYAIAQKIPFAEVQNKAGRFIKPSIESISAAARALNVPDTRVMLTNSPDPLAYPLTGFTWIILYREQSYNQRSLQHTRETLKFLRWLIGPEAQSSAATLNYAPLPDKAVKAAMANINSFTYEGKSVIEY